MSETTCGADASTSAASTTPTTASRRPNRKGFPSFGMMIALALKTNSFGDARRESLMHYTAKYQLAKLLSKNAVNRSGAWVEYPVVKGVGAGLIDEYQNLFEDLILKTFPFEKTLHITSAKTPAQDLLANLRQELDEHIRDKMGALPKTEQLHNDWVPTYDTCREAGLTVLAVVDVAVPYKGGINEVWDVTYKHPLTREKVDVLRKELGNIDIYEISAEWILNRDVNESLEETLSALYDAATAWP